MSLPESLMNHCAKDSSFLTIAKTPEGKWMIQTGQLAGDGTWLQTGRGDSFIEALLDLERKHEIARTLCNATPGNGPASPATTTGF